LGTSGDRHCSYAKGVTAWMSTKCKLAEAAAAVAQSHHCPDFRSPGSAWLVGWSYAAFQSASSGSGVLEVGNIGRIQLIRNNILRGREEMETCCRTSLSKIGFSLRSK